MQTDFLSQPSICHLLKTVPVQLLRRGNEIGYGWAIAQKIAALNRVSAQVAAQHLLPLIHHSLADSEFPTWLSVPAHVLPHLQVTAGETGLIRLVLTDIAIAGWCEWVLQIPGEFFAKPVPAKGELSPTLEFRLQHSHARCCSLLHLAQREGRLLNLQTATGYYQWVESQPVAWLDPAQILLLQHPSETQLIRVLFHGIHSWQASAPITFQQRVKIADSLATAFQNFHRDRPLWVNCSAQAQKIQLAQLALLTLTQNVLYGVLSSLAIAAPAEL
ncbi:MAG TPA: hypothetical protein IGS53_25945 [Leptolyngbyaceae cyanobacterium M33_DOE_097]|uniref:DALR anticodon binding domain-containing protein n=1 Tax=Oscillatoriales cyanobacterium SpSt-418 TaxID=2282169 RepID=A0A7C3PIT5_9CYAN|nr:hypothetical protein [Leptolyngbyaceae cyanobacterium M33_DOE_097]